jgi:hypothetical protein
MQPTLSAAGQKRRMASGQSVRHVLHRWVDAPCINVLKDDLESCMTLYLVRGKEPLPTGFSHANFNFCTFTT